MSLSIEIYDHPNAGFYYVVFQHNEVYQLNGFTKRGQSHCQKLGELWPKGEFGLGLKFGTHLRLQDVPKAVIDKIMTITTETITNVQAD